MTRWKKLALVAGIGVGIGVVAVGAGVARASGPEGWIGRRVRWAKLMRELHVTRNQARELRAAGVHLAVERKALDLEALSPSQRQERLFHLRRDFFARAEEVLTEEQKSQLRTQWAEARQARQQKLEEQLAHAAEKLQLSPEQRQLAHALVQRTREQVRETMADTRVDEPARLAKAIGTLEEVRGELYRLLTPEQKEKAKGMVEKGLLAHLPQNPRDGSAD